MLTSGYREPPEWIRLELDRERWDVAYRARTPLFAHKQFVLRGETLQDWTELVTWNANFSVNGLDLRAAEEGLLRNLRAQCPSLESRKIRSEAGDRIFEWWHDGCYERPAQHELVRLIAGELGTHTVTYGLKGAPLEPAEQERWLAWLSALEPGERLPLDSDALGPFDRVQVAVWKGDYERAHELLRPLIEAEDARAVELSARLHAEGWGVLRDYEKARELFEGVADQNAEAAFNLGRLYENGWGVEPDPAPAYRWYAQAAQAGNVEAQTRAGFMLAEGIGTEQDLIAAYRWFEKAAAQGHEHARYWVARLTAQGVVAEAPDLERARDLYEQVARDGEFEAQYELGVLCARAELSSCGEPEAKIWLVRAMMQGNEEAREFYVKRFGRSSG